MGFQVELYFRDDEVRGEGQIAEVKILLLRKLLSSAISLLISDL